MTALKIFVVAALWVVVLVIVLLLPPAVFLNNRGFEVVRPDVDFVMPDHRIGWVYIRSDLSGARTYGDPKIMLYSNDWAISAVDRALFRPGGPREPAIAKIRSAVDSYRAEEEPADDAQRESWAQDIDRLMLLLVNDPSAAWALAERGSDVLRDDPARTLEGWSVGLSGPSQSNYWPVRSCWVSVALFVAGACGSVWGVNRVFTVLARRRSKARVAGLGGSRDSS